MENSEVDNPSEWWEVLNVLPFEGYEKAMWTLRLEVPGGVLDLFGLEDYPTAFHQTHDIPVAGELAYSLRGTDTSLTDLVHEAKRWWSPFRGLTFLGRPKGTGRWSSREHFLAEAKAAVAVMRVEGEKITQETVAARLYTSDRMLRDWIKRFESSWLEIKHE
jgi:hypothetical protein